MSLYRVPGGTDPYVRKSEIKAFHTHGMWLRLKMDDGTSYESLQTHESYDRFLREMQEDSK